MKYIWRLICKFFRLFKFKIAPVINLDDMPVLKRPSFDEYFLMLAFVASYRSEDMFIKHGAIIVNNQNNNIIGTGYNGLIRGADKTKININDRDSRRVYCLHAEENAIINSYTNPSLLPSGATIYVTGIPCLHCLQLLINFGVSRIVYADRDGTITENEYTQEIRDNILSMSNIKYEKFDINNDWIKMINL